MDDLFERVTIRMEAQQHFDDLVSSVRFDIARRGYEPDDVERLIVRLGGTLAEVDHKSRVPLGRRGLIRVLLWVAGATFVVALAAIGIAYMRSSGSRSQIAAILAICGLGVSDLAWSAKDFVRDEAFDGSDVRSFLVACMLVLGGFGGALNGASADSGWGRFSGVAIGLAGLPAFTLYLRKIWIRFRDPPGGQHQT